jgi:hypothetical protein
MQPDSTAKMQIRAKAVRASIFLFLGEEAQAENITQEIQWKESSLGDNGHSLLPVPRERHGRPAGGVQQRAF